MAINTAAIVERIANRHATQTREKLEAPVAQGYAPEAESIADLDSSVRSQAQSDLDQLVTDARQGIADMATIIVEEIVDELIPEGNFFLKKTAVKVTIPVGVVTQGAGTAAAPNTAPIQLSGEVEHSEVEGETE